MTLLLPSTKIILSLSFLNHSAIISCSMEYKFIFKNTVLYRICSYFNVYDPRILKYNICDLASYLFNRCVTISVSLFLKLYGGARWCSSYGSRLQPLRPSVRILGQALHVGKLVVTCRCPVVYSALCTGFLHL